MHIYYIFIHTPHIDHHLQSLSSNPNLGSAGVWCIYIYMLQHDEIEVVVIKQAPVAPNWTRSGVPYIVFGEEPDGDIPGA